LNRLVQGTRLELPLEDLGGSGLGLLGVDHGHDGAPELLELRLDRLGPLDEVVAERGPTRGLLFRVAAYMPVMISMLPPTTTPRRRSLRSAECLSNGACGTALLWIRRAECVA
jgi:hypothetical protein